MGHRETIALGLTILVIIVVPGIANAVLTSVGYDTLGSIIWVIGYGSGVLFVWYNWVRPLDLMAPDGVETGGE